LGFLPFFFLDEKEPKNQGCGKIAKNGFVRLNPPNSPAKAGSNSGGFLTAHCTILLTLFFRGRSYRI
jgi:hypothetical protein